MKIRGSHLGPRLQKQVLAQFVHRFTGDHKPSWANEPRPDGSAYPVQFRDDQDWLANTFFEITAKGELSRRTRHCESHPTWPNGKGNEAA